ncbi:hypothetical protein BC629DRAFT_1197159 [Irpex lacteus]|nr:hypothetical protein BC629DRAFT_1197159 [Irpex lacteus]
MASFIRPRELKRPCGDFQGEYMHEGKQRRTRCSPGCSTLITALLKVRQSFRAEVLAVSYPIQIVACHPQQRVCSRQRPITRSVDIIPHRRARQIHANTQRHRCDEMFVREDRLTLQNTIVFVVARAAEGPRPPLRGTDGTSVNLTRTATIVHVRIAMSSERPQLQRLDRRYGMTNKTYHPSGMEACLPRGRAASACVWSI